MGEPTQRIHAALDVFLQETIAGSNIYVTKFPDLKLRGFSCL
jgi:hypothetical protein